MNSEGEGWLCGCYGVCEEWYCRGGKGGMRQGLLCTTKSALFDVVKGRPEVGCGK